jgi:hypothetical protein
MERLLKKSKNGAADNTGNNDTDNGIESQNAGY